MSNVLKYINKKGEFVRKDSEFRDCVTADGSSGFKAETGRYHLYVSLACPWAHRALVARKLKGLEDVISIDVVDWFLGDKGWQFTGELDLFTLATGEPFGRAPAIIGGGRSWVPLRAACQARMGTRIEPPTVSVKANCTPDTVNGCSYLSEIYFKANPEYSGSFTVPVLYDKQKTTIVNNESSEIIRMLNSEFNHLCPTDAQSKLDFYPEYLRDKIDEVNEWTYTHINNGVYMSGFATSQQAYNVAVNGLFEHLDKAEEILSKQRFLAGSRFTEADIRLFTTLVRFDWVYHGHFKCNKKMLKEYRNLWAYTRDIYQMNGVSETMDTEHIRKHYHVSHTSINPYRILPLGADLDFMEPHGRDTLGEVTGV